LNRRTRIVVDTLLPAGAHPSLAKGALEAGFETFLRDLEAAGPRRMRLGVKAAMFAAIWVSPILIWRFPPISIYRRESRERALEALSRSRLYPLRQLFGLLKLTVALCYGADRDVRDAIGYPLQHDDPRRAGNR
jgi:hypothetical protein